MTIIVDRVGGLKTEMAKPYTNTRPFSCVLSKWKRLGGSL